MLLASFLAFHSFTTTPLTLGLNHSNGTSENINVNHTYNQQQIEWFKEGAALNIIRKQIVV